MEAGEALDQFSQQEIVKDCILLLVNCEEALFLGDKVFTKLSEFFKEITSDNKIFCQEIATEDLIAKMKTLCQNINEENMEFISNLIHGLFNIY